jgi:cytidylate kinase
VSERTYTAQLLGKSVDDFKLWLPAPLKVDLEALAKAEDLGLSDYIRKTLIRILLGESFHHQWRKAVGKLPDEVRRFEQGI